MIHLVKARMTIEVGKFRLLSHKARNLIFSYLLQGVANPILGTFMNAYIWKVEGDFKSVAIFNLGNMIGLPLTFLLNGILLRRFHVSSLYAFGSSMLGATVVLIVLLARVGNVSYLLFGLIFGLGYGFYWANRNYLTLDQTKSHNRNYFLGINFTLDTVTSIAVPFAIGWFIYLGEKFGIGTYVINSIFAFIFLVISGLLVLNGNYKTPTISKIIAGKTTSNWNFIRLLNFALGIVDGLAFFVVSLIVLHSVGHEGILGSVDSISSIFLGALFYYYGRKAKIHHQRLAYLISFAVGIIGCLFLLNGADSLLSVVIFTTFYYFSIAFMWLTAEPIMMDYLDRETRGKPGDKYSLIADREIFLNMGRWVSILTFFTALKYFGNEISVTVSPFITYMAHLLLIIPVFKVVRK